MSDILKIEPIDNWLKKNNWSFYNHQVETLKLSENGFDVLLVAPTGGGKTLAGFLPSLNDLINNKPKIGAEGYKIVFIHPKSTGGVLVELAEKPK